MQRGECIAELRRREATLGNEIADWVARAKANIASTGLHQKQLGEIQRVHEQLATTRTALLAALELAPSDTAFADRYAEVLEEIVGARELWRIYRTGLEQHNFSPFKDFVHEGMLAAKDIFDTALAASGVQEKLTPPIMLILEAAASPAAAGRASIAADTGFVVRLYRAMQLPVPIVLVPADQASSVWALVHLAHEVGHTLSQELGDLTKALFVKLANLPATIPPDRTARWTRWASELLADLFGVSIAGPAFGSALSHVLLPLANATRFQTLDQGAAGPSTAHPPPHLRRVLLVALLRAASAPELTQMAELIDAEWATLPPPAYVADYAPDVPAIVDTLRALTAPGGKLVRDLAAYAPDPRFATLVKFLGGEVNVAPPIELPDRFARRYIPMAAELARRSHPDQLETIHTRALAFAHNIPFVQFAGSALDVVGKRAAAFSFSSKVNA